jgi:hypothetical protein
MNQRLDPNVRKFLVQLKTAESEKHLQISKIMKDKDGFKRGTLSKEQLKACIAVFLSQTE